MAGGRPTKYKPEYCEMLIKHMSSGLPYETFAAEVDASREVLYDWEKAHPEFLHAKKKGRAAQYKFLAMVGRNAMAGKVPGFNATAWVFFMKNCCGWKDKIEISEDDEVDDIDFEG